MNLSRLYLYYWCCW